MVHVTALNDDYYYFDEASQSLIGRRSGVEYRLGSPVKVVVARVDVDRRHLDFRLAGTSALPPAAPVAEPPRRKPSFDNKNKPSRTNKQFPQQKFGKQRSTETNGKKKGKSKKKKR